ncbi:hypothetical protein CR203_09960 [Salipaludibacillus neizhouensis]|uniref:DUF4227 domain-containing protein n=1 Tax=Salipaludibacillus neizhouensis TaxID=885475 RepID=A0A3A9K3K6_9BACI|nr:YqzK family protein [Salipaludibacillus neizhouensis]RKL67664.1 hypothetical protein CR203_09960 [Salipaludibacillus neizhouensis]
MRLVNQIFQGFWVFFLFMGCTIVFYYGILWVSDVYEQYDRYEEPQGKALKVFQISSFDEKKDVTFTDRLRIFLTEGE